MTARAPARRLLAVLTLVATLATASLTTAGCGLFADSGPDDVAERFLAAWSAGDLAGAAALTDDPTAANELLAGVRDGLRPAGLAARADQVRTAADRATASVGYDWDLGAGRHWRYVGEFELRPTPGGAGDGWQVHWAPTVVHPRLAARQRLALRSELPEPAPVVDRAGVPVLAPTTVVNVLFDRLAAGDAATIAARLAAAIAPLDPSVTAQSITDGAARVPDGQAYQVAALRETDYLGIKNAIHDLPGVRFTSTTRLLPPDASFGRQVLPAVRDLVADRTAGVPGWSVLTVDAAGNVVTTLVDEPPTPGTTVAVSLDRTIQSAAEDAVEPLPGPAVLVAVAPSTGDVLAVAQNGPADAQGALALTGRFPPGSTFKIVTAATGLGGGLGPDSPVACPATTTVDGRALPNSGGFDLGTVPLRTAFARSCNTSFAGLAAGYAPDALTTTALRFGLGADYAVPGLTTVTGSVPPADDWVQRAEDGIGQGDVLASPFGMALVAATVARGAPVVPRLVPDRPTAVTVAATDPDPAVLGPLRTLMREVVLAGTASALAPLGEVYGKTGTAQFGADGTRAHGWFAGYRGDVAFAVLTVDSGSSATAVEVSARFLRAVP